MKKLLSIFISLTFSGLIALPMHQASASSCKPVEPVGKSIGRIKAGDVSLPIIYFTYPAGGAMKIQGSTKMVGLSNRHMPLSSQVGTSVLLWHINYNHCWNDLNILTNKDAGYQFTIIDEKGKSQKYELTKRYIVNKGKYRTEWFDVVGPRKLLLVSCTGSFKDGHYTQNVVMIANPVN